MEDNLSETDIRDQEDDFRLMILFGGFVFIIASLILIICVTSCLLCCEEDLDSNSRNLQYLIQLTRISLASLPNLSCEDSGEYFAENVKENGYFRQKIADIKINLVIFCSKGIISIMENIHP